MALTNLTFITAERLNFRPLLLNLNQINALKTSLGTSNNLAFYLTEYVTEPSVVGSTNLENGIKTLRYAVVNPSNIILSVGGKVGVSIDTLKLKNTTAVFSSSTPNPPPSPFPISAILIPNVHIVRALDYLILKIGTYINSKVALFLITPDSTGKYKIDSKVISIPTSGGGPGSTEVKPAP